MNQFIKNVGMDVRNLTIAVSVAPSGGGEVRYVEETATLPNPLQSWSNNFERTMLT